MARKTSVILFLLLVMPWIHGQQPQKTDWKPPLASGGVPECPDRIGSRTLYSETVADGSAKAWIAGTSTRVQKGRCSYKADLVLSGAEDRSLALPEPENQGFDIADFSPDGKDLLLESETGPAQFRDVQIALVTLNSGSVKFVNVWNIFRWGQCDATVEPQGFTTGGRILLSVRPPDYPRPGRQECVPDQALYSTNLAGPPKRLPANYKIPRFGRELAPQRQACETDPDIIGACFTVHGRLSFWNGSPTARIWPVGTNRILGDHLDWPLPADVARHMDFGVEAWGNFNVCPFTKNQPGVMQMVCIQSASHAFYRCWPPGPGTARPCADTSPAAKGKK